MGPCVEEPAEQLFHVLRETHGAEKRHRLYRRSWSKKIESLSTAQAEALEQLKDIR